MTHVNSDSRSKRLGLKSTDLLINHLKFIRDKVHEGSPDTQVCMWHALGMLGTPWGNPNPYPNFRETAIVSWKIPKKGEHGWVPFNPSEFE